MTKCATFLAVATVGPFLPGVEGSGSAAGLEFNYGDPFTIHFVNDGGAEVGTVAKIKGYDALAMVAEPQVDGLTNVQLRFRFRDGGNFEEKGITDHWGEELEYEYPKICGKICVADGSGPTSCLDKKNFGRVGGGEKLVLSTNYGESLDWCLAATVYAPDQETKYVYDQSYQRRKCWRIALYVMAIRFLRKKLCLVLSRSRLLVYALC